MDFFVGDNFKYLGAGAIIAAVIISICNVVLQFMRNRAERKLAKRRFKYDENLAERKFEYERELAERKLKLDIKRIVREKKLQLAEEVLALANDTKDNIRWIRSFNSSIEGVSRDRPDGESQTESYYKDLYYVTIERYDSRKEQINTFLSRKNRMTGSFSNDVGEAFDIFTREIYRVISSARFLINAKRAELSAQDVDKQRETIWSDFANDDPVDREINRAIQILEDICRPILSEQLDA